ncbi:MipA/OmpV family protein [Phaeobacter sp. 11ANDIMAR09]|uniref:MipA/OmpV family protein n=1 Tax=Phaeobacter sp. 11ANDIMAR09 TaxID=1225647 RepID=UPI0006C897DB|nr:MipA/OmpV family protein [Phaeobacter sp. 11ANDIMAR09]KPD10612.1 hypothetical protein AN476_19900 [Phaeobacter sp. 11ANDIMAR09]
MKPLFKLAAGAGVFLIAAFPAGRALAEGDWEGRIGIGAVSGPEFLGSSETDTGAMPMFELNWRDRIFIGPGGIGYSYNADAFTVSASVGYDFGRDESDSVFLNGLGDIDGGATFNLAFEYELGPVTPYLEMTKYTKGSEGVSATVGLEGTIPLRVLTGRMSMADMGRFDSPREAGPMLIAGLSADWGNDDFNQTYYGVSSAQAGTSGLSQFTATSGFHAVNLELGIRAPLTDRWSLGASVTYSELMGDAKNSPFVQDKSGTSVGLFAMYSF